MLKTCSYLLGTRGSEDCTSNTGSEQAIADEARKARLVTRSTTTYNRNIMGVGDRGRITIDDFVRGVEEKRGISEGQRIEVRKNSRIWISEIMLRRCNKELVVFPEMGREGRRTRHLSNGF